MFPGNARKANSGGCKTGIPLYLLSHLVAFIIMARPSLWWKIPFSIAIFVFSFWYVRLGPTPSPEPDLLAVEGSDETLAGIDSGPDPGLQVS